MKLKEEEEERLFLTTLLNLMNPLSLTLYPTLGPISPTTIPGRGL